MKFTVFGFSQSELIRLGLDTDDALILRWFVDFQQTGKMKRMPISGKTFHWVNYQAVLEDVPIIGITNKNNLARRFRKLVDAGILEQHVHTVGGKFSYFAIRETGFASLVDSSAPIAPKDDSSRPKSRDPIARKDETNLNSSTRNSSTKQRESARTLELKTAFGERGKVLLTMAEAEALIQRVGRPCFGRAVEILEAHLANSTRTYDDHYAAIVKWALKEAMNEPTLWRYPAASERPPAPPPVPTKDETEVVLKELQALVRA